MSLRWPLTFGSLVAHGVLVVALGKIRAPAVVETTSIEVTESKPEEPPPPAEVEPPPIEPTPAPPQPVRAKAAPAPPPIDPAPSAPSPSLAALPDLGLELSGGGTGPAIARPPETAPPASTVKKTLARAPEPRPSDGCAEPPSKPKLLSLPRPTYTDDARAAGIEGKVRVELTVDENGKVTAVRALSSLGHGLDEAAIAAAKGATFEPALRCGKAVRSTFTISVRFSAS